MSVFQVIIYKRLEEGLWIFFGNPAVLKLRTRGFVSPDYSGFALSETITVFFAVPLLVLQLHNNHIKKAHLVAEVSFSQVIIYKRLEEVLWIFFGNPAILTNRTRGFASPDYSGFALSVDSYPLNIIVTEGYPVSIKKSNKKWRTTHLLAFQNSDTRCFKHTHQFY